MNRLKVFLKDSNKKNIFKIIKEVSILAIKKKEIPYYYFKYLYRKNITNYLDYLSLKEQVKLQHHKSLHNPEYDSLINNKLYFSLLNKNGSIKTPKLLGYNFKSSFFNIDKLEKISKKKELVFFFEKIFEDQNIEGVFFRPPSDYGGKGCFKITKENYKKVLQDKYEMLIEENFVHTEVIKQHNLINQIHDKSINTLRIITLITSNGDIEIISAFIRFGVGDSVVDNASSGGFFIGIDIDDGTLKKKGHFLPEYGGKEIVKHPDSGFEFEGFKIPYYNEACDIVIEGVRNIPDRLIGWDVAITPNGPLIIESNSRPHFQMSNIAYGGLLKNKHVRDVLLELK